MSKGNGQADVSLEDQLKEEQLKDTQLKDEQNQTLEKELPTADPADGFEEKSAFARSPGFRSNRERRVGEAAR